MNIIIAILIFSLIIVIHELGHFLLAKKNGITVTEFSVGMGPRLITVVKTADGLSCKIFASTDACMYREDWKGHTKYSIKLFPIGGSCMMLGEDDIVEDPNAFNKKGVWARISVIAAGPIFNFILALVLSMIVIGYEGYDPSDITNIQENSPLLEAGLQEGDLITKINNTTIHFGREISMYFQFSPLTEKPVNITYKRGEEKNTVSVKPVQIEDGSYKLLFGFSPSARVKASPLEVIKYGTYNVKFWIDSTIKGLGQIIKGKVTKDDIAGPVGIVEIIGDTYEGAKPAGFLYTLVKLFNISILLSANLGVMNLLPIPALDGGRLVFLLIEAVRGKPINQEKEGLVHLIGLAALMILMVFVMFNDIGRIIGR